MSLIEAGDNVGSTGDESCASYFVELLKEKSDCRVPDWDGGSTNLDQIVRICSQWVCPGKLPGDIQKHQGC